MTEPTPTETPTGACCWLKVGGDECDCARWAAQVGHAFLPRDLSLGRLGPIHMLTERTAR